MSPLSVAQYLDAGFPPFDIVVFDEASQIPTWDAIGAIARGKQVVVVGDPKQLPPTSFFQRAEDDDEENTSEDVVEDSRASSTSASSARTPVAPPRLALPQPPREPDRLQQPSLLREPPAHVPRRAAIEGARGLAGATCRTASTTRGKSRTNREEAEAVVGEIVRRLADPTSCGACSIGVVTFSQAQQTLIEDLLEEARARRTRRSSRSSPTAIAEPVFVKNLENVQGDERDVILFSICYGPDAHGPRLDELRPAEPRRRRAASQRRHHPGAPRGRGLLDADAPTRSTCLGRARAA